MAFVAPHYSDLGEVLRASCNADAFRAKAYGRLRPEVMTQDGTLVPLPSTIWANDKAWGQMSTTGSLAGFRVTTAMLMGDRQESGNMDIYKLLPQKYWENSASMGEAISGRILLLKANVDALHACGTSVPNCEGAGHNTGSDTERLAETAEAMEHPSSGEPLKASKSPDDKKGQEINRILGAARNLFSVPSQGTKFPHAPGKMAEDIFLHRKKFGINLGRESIRKILAGSYGPMMKRSIKSPYAGNIT